MLVFPRQNLATGDQIALAQRAHHPVVVHPFPAGFAHRAGNRWVAPAPQQAALKLIDTREGEHAPAHLFPHQIQLHPHIAVLDIQQRRVVGEGWPEALRRQFNGHRNALRQRADGLHHVADIVVTRRKGAQHQMLIFTYHRAGHGAEALGIAREAAGVDMRRGIVLPGQLPVGPGDGQQAVGVGKRHQQPADGRDLLAEQGEFIRQILTPEFDVEADAAVFINQLRVRRQQVGGEAQFLGLQIKFQPMLLAVTGQPVEVHAARALLAGEAIVVLMRGVAFRRNEFIKQVRLPHHHGRKLMAGRPLYQLAGFVPVPELLVIQFQRTRLPHCLSPSRHRGERLL